MGPETKIHTPESGAQFIAPGMASVKPVHGMDQKRPELGLNASEDTEAPAEAADGPDVAKKDRSGATTKFLAAISGDSEVDAQVCRMARNLSLLGKGHVTFVNVVSHVTDPVQYGALGPVYAGPVPQEVGLQSLDDTIEQRKKLFNDFVAHHEMPESYSFQVESGLIDEEILNAAHRCDASMIIVGSSERTWLEGILSSDVAQQVAKRSDRPVLIVPEPSQD